MRYYENHNLDGTVIEVHIADIHFGSIDPAVQYSILFEQFIAPIRSLKFDILSIDGDLFDKKFLASAPAIDYANRFVMDCMSICKEKQATMIILAGTRSHDANQLSMFYGYCSRDDIDFRIVEHIQFEYAKGLKILCIPEEYGMPADYYADLLCQTYDTVFMHGTVVGSVYGANKYVLESSKAPIFNFEAFGGCRGPIIAGHVHKAACYNQYIYYVSNPIRYRFGEEEEKGYAIVLHNSHSGHLYKFMPIHSFRYDTIDVNTITYADPDALIAYLNNLQNNGIDYIRIDFTNKNDPVTQSLVEKYYSNNPNFSIKRYTDTSSSSSKAVDNTTVEDDRFKDMAFLVDKELDGYSKFVQFVNYNEGKQLLTVDMLKQIIAGGKVAL